MTIVALWNRQDLRSVSDLERAFPAGDVRMGLAQAEPEATSLSALALAGMLLARRMRTA
jgi:hypothetical protein